MSLAARIAVQRPGFALDVDLDVAAGEVVALLGPNGAGKTTALRVLAGLQRHDGRVLLGGRLLDPLPPEQRRVGLVPQDGLLLPHLRARDDVAYGLRARGTPRAQALRRAEQELARVGLADRADARAHELSGGQAQRVALARALATDPDLLLLDEPLASLDALTRTSVRTDLRTRLSGFAGPVVLVTHDPVDALVLADRLVVLEDGAVVQEGAPRDVARRPQTAYVAGLVGLVLLAGTARGGTVEAGGAVLPAPGAAGEVLVAVAPEAVRLHTAPVEGAAPVRVVAVEQQGATVRVALDSGLVAAVAAARLAELDLTGPLWAEVTAAEVYAASSPRSRRSLAT